MSWNNVIPASVIQMEIIEDELREMGVAIQPHQRVIVYRWVCRGMSAKDIAEKLQK